VTTEQIIRFFDQRPFEPFSFTLVNGREIQALHPEQISVGRHGSIVFFFHPTRQIEVIDTSLIVSIRTVYAADFSSWTG
jgi:hypothetical protein